MANAELTWHARCNKRGAIRECCPQETPVDPKRYLVPVPTVTTPSPVAQLTSLGSESPHWTSLAPARVPGCAVPRFAVDIDIDKLRSGSSFCALPSPCAAPSPAQPRTEFFRSPIPPPATKPSQIPATSKRREPTANNVNQRASPRATGHRCHRVQRPTWQTHPGWKGARGKRDALTSMAAVFACSVNCFQHLKHGRKSA